MTSDTESSTLPPIAIEPMAEPALPPAEKAEPQPTERLVSLDAFRGLVMLLMVSAGLQIPEVVRNFGRNSEWQHLKTPLWEKLAFHTDHVPWTGCALWDLIQPCFMFMVGVALAFSIASRKAKGPSFNRMLAHAVFRSVALVLLAVFLTSNHSRNTVWQFPNVLAQIGLGYTFLFLLAWLKPRWQLAAAGGILLLYWAAFVIYPKPAADLDLKSVDLPANWQRLEGFASHWEKNTNFAARADQWLLNLLPQFGKDGKPAEFKFNGGGYQTLNFIPSLATMVFGLLAGQLIRSPLSAAKKLGVMVLAGAAGLGLGWLLGHFGICPIVKRIWTPSWALFSAGWAFLALALFYLIIDIAKLRLWAFPLVVVGMNSIAIYCMSMLLKPWFRENIQRHFGTRPYDLFGKPYAPMVEAGLFLLFCWLVCWWMYRKKVFIRI